MEGSSDKAATVSEITMKEHHSKVDSKTLAQRCRKWLGPEQQTPKTIAQVGFRHAVHPITI